MKARKNAPTKTTKPDEPQCYRVWADNPVYLEDQVPWKCLATFYYLTECLEYIAYCQDRGHNVVFQSPAHTSIVKSTDRRAIWKPDGGTSLATVGPIIELPKENVA